NKHNYRVACQDSRQPSLKPLSNTQYLLAAAYLKHEVSWQICSLVEVSQCTFQAAMGSSTKARYGRRSPLTQFASDSFCPARCGCCNCSLKRYLTAFLCHIGLIIIFGFRCSIGVATGHFRDSERNATAGASVAKSSVHWSTSQLSTVESSYFWGYLVLQIPAGIVATRYPATLVYSLTTLGSSVINILLPLCIRSSTELTIVARVLQGLLEGFSYPACNGILSHWAPPLERSRLSTIVFCGGFFGSFLGLLSSGWLSERFGWPVMFYLYGALGVAWFCVFTACVSEKPSSDRCITDEEREYIEIEIGESFSSKHVISPALWLKIFTSMPVYAIIVANFVRNWTFYLMITEPTKYFDDVFGYGMSKSGFFASLPHLVMSVVVPVSGVIADELRKRWLSTTAVRKIFNTLGFGVRGLFLLGVGHTSDATTATVCMIIGVGFSGCCMAGYNANHLDIAPRYASCLMGLSNGIGTVGSILVPIVTMQLVKDRSRASWSNVFLITSIINFVGVIFYAMFASGEKQSWAEAPADEEPWKPPTPTATAFKDVGYDNEEVFEALEDDTSRNVADATPADFSKSPLFPTRANFVQQS
ncbi:hypothetical protein BOX15_Mlig021934g1, partial [Macrostomum lignano]